MTIDFIFNNIVCNQTGKINIESVTKIEERFCKIFKKSRYK